MAKLKLQLKQSASNVSITLSGKATDGYPLPEMYLAIYVDDVKVKEGSIPSAGIGLPYTLSTSYDVVGVHSTYGVMVLTNPLGKAEYKSDVEFFSIVAALFTLTSSPKVARPGEPITIAVENPPQCWVPDELFWMTPWGTISLGLVGMHYDEATDRWIVEPGLEKDAAGYVIGGYFTKSLPKPYFWGNYYNVDAVWGTQKLKIKARTGCGGNWVVTWHDVEPFDVPKPILIFLSSEYVKTELPKIYRRLRGTLTQAERPYPTSDHSRNVTVGVFVGGIISSVGSVPVDENGDWSLIVAYEYGSQYDFIATVTPIDQYGVCLPNFPCIKTDRLTVAFVP